MVKTIYHYQDPPEVQSPEHRSVVFASLANLFTFLIGASFCQGWIELCIKGRAEFWFDVAVPILVSVVILYTGCLWTDWPRPVRVVGLLLLSGFMLVAMLVYLFFIMIVGMFYYGASQQLGGC